MTKFGYCVFVVLIITALTLLALLYLDMRGEEPAREPKVSTEVHDVRQP